MKSLPQEEVRLYGESMADLVECAKVTGLESGFGGFDASAQFRSTMHSKLKLFQKRHGSDAAPEPLRVRLNALRARHDRVRSSGEAIPASYAKSLATTPAARLFALRRITRCLALTSLACLTLSLVLPNSPWQAWGILPLLGMLIEFIPFRAAGAKAWGVLSAAYFWSWERHLERKLEIAESKRNLAEEWIGDNLAHLMSVYELERVRAYQAAIRSGEFNVPSAVTDVRRDHDRGN
jgi:hypothetical protein